MRNVTSCTKEFPPMRVNTHSNNSINSYINYYKLECMFRSGTPGATPMEAGNSCHLMTGSMSREGKPQVIVVVDDEVVVRNLVMTLLVRAGYHVLSAADGQEALELIRAYPDP